MRRLLGQGASLGLVLVLGIGTTSAARAPSARPASGISASSGRDTLETPGWMEVDRARERVALEVVAGDTDANDGWNFNGHARGDARITVPAGFQVTIEFVNPADNLVAHSLGVDELRESWPAIFSDPTPSFEGATTEDPTRMKGATQPGESETVVFTASEPGAYALVCYVPGHATAGMWIHFAVSAEGAAGFAELE